MISLSVTVELHEPPLYKYVYCRPGDRVGLNRIYKTATYGRGVRKGTEAGNERKKRPTTFTLLMKSGQHLWIVW